MREICVPIPLAEGSEVAEVEVKLSGKQESIKYRLESFFWCSSDDKFTDELSEKLSKIYHLKKSIEGYDKDWEVIQIFTPAETATRIQVLFRKK